MGKKLFGNVEPRCKYCRHGIVGTESELILCKKRGVNDPDDFCKKFKYDPLRRIPLKTPPLPKFSKEDFEL